MKQSIYFILGISLITFNLHCMEQEKQASTHADPYIKVLSFLDAFIVGGGIITSPADNTIEFGNMYGHNQYFTQSTHDALELLQHATDEDVNTLELFSFSDRIKRRIKLCKQDKVTAVKAMLEALSYDEKVCFQSDRLSVLRSLNGFTGTSQELQNMLEAKVVKENERICQRLQIDQSEKAIQEVQSMLATNKQVPAYVVSRFELIQALQSGKEQEIDRASKNAITIPGRFGRLEEYIEQEFTNITEESNKMPECATQ